jgi:Tfp pilus assembly PilM family ATPase
MDRVRFITHQGKQILLVDYTNCTRQTLLDILKERERIVLAQPKGSVLMLVDLTGAQFSKDTVEEVKVVAVRERDRVKRAALVGEETQPKVFRDAVRTFAARDYHPFPTREAALDWLVQDDDEAVQK